MEIDKEELSKLIRHNLRWCPYGPRICHKVLDCFVVGSVAKGCATAESDLDIALVIAPVKGKTAIEYTEQYYNRWETLAIANGIEAAEKSKPHFNGLPLDFQFFYSEPGKGGQSDMLPDNYSKIEVF